MVHACRRLTKPAVACSGAQVMDALPEWAGELEVRLGHRALLEACLSHARVPKVRPPVRTPTAWKASALAPGKPGRLPYPCT